MTRAPDTVGEIMTAEVVTVSATDPVAQAVRAMIDHDIGSVVVVDGPRAAGVLTERDLIRRLLDEPNLLAARVGDVMSSPVVSTAPATEIVEAFDLMNRSGIRRLPVVDADRLVGIVTERDLMRWVSRVAAE
ncbi:MAG TPA: CBS domain-containing protein [Actinomycetota bacterium]|nr:CBS domain-containing protein [Actinomycetota bacterium]